MSRNPYHREDQEPSLLRSVFVFMDILGYADILRQSEADGTQQTAFRDLHKALTAGRKWLQDEDLPEELAKMGRTDLFALKAFTDNIVIGWPVRDDAESEIGSAFFKLGLFQFQMVLAGYFIRGALAVNDAYVDEIAVFGSALIEAHQGESALARDPRIILTSSAVEATKQHLTYYTPARHAPHVREVLRDTDGQWFLNYLECVLWAEDEQGPFYEELRRHKQVVEDKLSAYKANPPIWSKYAWAASYHNYFCDLHSHHFDEEHKINVELYRATPGLIVDER